MAVVAAALILAAPAAGGGSVAKIPTPAPGKVRVELLTIKATSTPKLTVTNLAALGSGFHGAAVVGTRKKTPGRYFAYLVMFNSSTSTAGTMNLEVSNGTPTGAPFDDSENCSALTAIEYGFPGWGVLLDSLAYMPLKHGKSPPKTEIKNDVSYQAKSAGCS
jgi:hypothetical protein